MARTSNSNSESEARPTGGRGNNAQSSSTSNKANQKQRLTNSQQQYLKDLAQTHITNNHPSLIPKSNPVDFQEYPDEFLRKYKDNFHLDVADNLTLQGYLLGSQLGSKTYSFKRNDNMKYIDARVTKPTLAHEVKKHFTQYNVKESDCIPKFIYKVKNNKKKFKMEFRG
ncbi:hypothetical protein NCAS_0C00570 [Naumovozyma castellii]|uniref:Histone deacetylase complex subunit SAP30 Sin3 binding domain-containing protein n=1 Tax=Naumovozyma castellii TaxID=27288 RepID=G0VC40_NAUCA|nr:hypothetical protein NCAS_0C00570 [Naumovozyma castellii CBS 4309]CCC69047.1 hypothetical protein NCAS_0C00570 [Naumovozyma castellii CBS 4309]